MRAIEFLKSKVNSWSRKQLIKFITDHDTEALRSMALAELESTFADCETTKDMESGECRANFDYLTDPLRIVGGID